MNKLINTIGIIVLFGILLKLSYVFIFLFDKLDNGSFVAKATGVTFALASVYFVVKSTSTPLKIIMVTLDIATILYFYLYDRLSLPIEYASLIVAAYSGLIVYYLGKTVAATIDSDAATIRLQELEHRQTIDSERLSIESEIVKCRRRIRQSRTDDTRKGHEARLVELENELNQLKN
ncbi:hypothetical protein FACS18945_5880 [Bacteroidia bacterium]|nr:hypothetical protein FACS18945_5880 [Bacteroidia bacterium]